MTTRQESLQNLAEAMKVARESYQRIRVLVVNQLPPYQAKAYQFVINQQKVTPRDLADHFKLKINQGSNVLKELWRLGLLNRRHEISDEGRQFIYWVNK